MNAVKMTITIYMFIRLTNSVNVSWHGNVIPETGDRKLYYDVHYTKYDRRTMSYELRPLCVWGIKADEMTPKVKDDDASQHSRHSQSSLPPPSNSQPIMVRPQESDYSNWMVFYPNYSNPTMICVDIEALCACHARIDWIGFRLECMRHGANILKYTPSIPIINGEVNLLYLRKLDMIMVLKCMKKHWIQILYGIFFSSLILFVIIQAITWKKGAV